MKKECEKMAKLKMLSFCEKIIFLVSNIFMQCIMSLYCVYKVLFRMFLKLIWEELNSSKQYIELQRAVKSTRPQPLILITNVHLIDIKAHAKFYTDVKTVYPPKTPFCV